MEGTKNIEKANRHMLADEDAIAEGLWLRNQIAGLGINMAEFARITGLDFRGVVARIGKKQKQNSKHYWCLSTEEVKIVAHELGIPALYILVAFNYPGYSMKTHIKEHDVKAVDAIADIRNTGRHLAKNPPVSKRGRKPKQSIKEDPLFDLAKTLEAENTVIDIPKEEEKKGETMEPTKCEILEDTEVVYVPIKVGAFRKRLRERFTDDVTVKVAFDTDRLVIYISSKKFGIDRRYETTPIDGELNGEDEMLADLFKQDVMDILFRKEGEAVD